MPGLTASYCFGYRIRYRTHNRRASGPAPVSELAANQNLHRRFLFAPKEDLTEQDFAKASPDDLEGNARVQWILN
jgi:hypothetical protein